MNSIYLTLKKEIAFLKHKNQEGLKRLPTVAGIKGFKHASLPTEKNQVLLNG